MDIANPVRLTVTYQTPRSLLAEFTRSIGRGGVTLESRKALPVGTRFLFELRSVGGGPPVEVQGLVLKVDSGVGGKSLLNIRYDPGVERESLDQVVGQFFAAHQHERLRKHPRIPLNLPGTEQAPYSPRYLIRDISLGGVGVEVEADRLPRGAGTGEAFLLEISLLGGTLALHGEIIWTFLPRPGSALQNPAFGVRFGTLRGDVPSKLERLIHLQALPAPPWRSRLSFGMEAVSRMP